MRNGFADHRFVGARNPKQLTPRVQAAKPRTHDVPLDLR
jgi:hypothetical protein